MTQEEIINEGRAKLVGKTITEDEFNNFCNKLKNAIENDLQENINHHHYMAKRMAKEYKYVKRQLELSKKDNELLD